MRERESGIRLDPDRLTPGRSGGILGKDEESGADGKKNVGNEIFDTVTLSDSGCALPPPLRSRDKVESECNSRERGQELLIHLLPGLKDKTQQANKSARISWMANGNTLVCFGSQWKGSCCWQWGKPLRIGNYQTGQGANLQ